MYRRIVERVHAGESYYDAAGTELKAGGFPTGSMFNWRLPTYAWVNGKLPSPAWGQVFLGILAVVTVLLMFRLLGQEGGVWMGATGGLLAVGFFAWCAVGDAFLVQELWAGTLIALSVCAYARQRWQVGLVAGLAALFYRELALGYCVVAAVLAWRERRRLEAGLWVAGFAFFALFLAFHGMMLAQHSDDGRRGSALDWFALGGLPFVLKTCRTNLFLLAAPGWVTALYLPLALLGLLGWRSPIGLRVAATVVLYLAAFAVVGRPFNYYWGMMIAPLLCMGFVWSPVALYHLLQAIRRPVAEPAVREPASVG